MTVESPRLQRLVRERPVPEEPRAEERCDLCGRPVPEEHRHMLDLDSREVRCACRACALLFDRRGAGGGHFRLIPERRLLLDGFELSDLAWEELRVPVDMAFFFRAGDDGSVKAYYPSPMGPTESLLGLEAWGEVEQANPVLAELEPDVEALLVNRARGARAHYVVPIDDCYRLVGLIRTRWRGFTGGREVWEEIASYFGELDERSHRWPA
jgi:hypothetical protein